jgi:hypothetical protein
MENPAQWTQLILGLLLGAGGLTGFLNAVAALRNRKAGTPGTETEARVEADEKDFAEYLRREVRRERADGDRRVDNVQRRLDSAEVYIEALEQHIWMKYPPPPPVRRHPEEGKDHG